MIRIFALTLLALLPGVAQARGGTVIGNGGDAVFCEAGSTNSFSGYYSLDYLAKYDPNNLPGKVASLDASLDRIERAIHAKLPEMSANFREFRKNLFNETDFSRRHIWEKAAFGLVDLKDEALVTLLPSNCTDNGAARVVQAVIRQPPSVEGFPEDKVNYKYVPEVVTALKEQNPLQLSFLILHEWLWDFSRNVERNRRVNYWLHSELLESWSREEWVRNLHAIGFAIPLMQEPVWENAICEPDADNLNKVTFEGNFSRRKFFMGSGKVFKRVTTCSQENGCGAYTDDSATFRRGFRSPMNLEFFLGSLQAISGISKVSEEISVYFMCALEADGTSRSCVYKLPGNDLEYLDLVPTVGKDCVIFRGRRITASRGGNKVEEFAVLFPDAVFPD